MFLIGCEIDYLIYYIQCKFTDDMSWDNYGLYGWHIDHKIPCAKFDLSKESEQRVCFHYTNLQSLWVIDNWKKQKGNTQCLMHTNVLNAEVIYLVNIVLFVK